MARGAPVNSGARSLTDIIRERVARTHVKYHRWAKADRTLRFGDLFKGPRRHRPRQLTRALGWPNSGPGDGYQDTAALPKATSKPLAV
jgi:hypothetical protein